MTPPDAARRIRACPHRTRPSLRPTAGVALPTRILALLGPDFGLTLAFLTALATLVAAFGTSFVWAKGPILWAGGILTALVMIALLSRLPAILRGRPAPGARSAPRPASPRATGGRSPSSCGRSRAWRRTRGRSARRGSTTPSTAWTCGSSASSRPSGRAASITRCSPTGCPWGMGSTSSFRWSWPRRCRCAAGGATCASCRRPSSFRWGSASCCFCCSPPARPASTRRCSPGVFQPAHLRSWTGLYEMQQTVFDAVDPLRVRSAFPSLHCSIGLLTLFYSWRFGDALFPRHRRLYFWICLPLVVSLWLSTDLPAPPLGAGHRRRAAAGPGLGDAGAPPASRLAGCYCSPR